MQKELIVLEETQIPALGAAILGAAAFERVPLHEAARKYGTTCEVIFKPNKKNEKVYETLYKHYQTLNEIFYNNPLMPMLNELKMGEYNDGEKFMGHEYSTS